METYVIGSGAFEEELALVGDKDFDARNLSECRTYIEQIARHFGVPPGRAYLFIETEWCDFGRFSSVAIRFDPDDPDELAYANAVEDGCPSWDEVSLDELGR